MLPKPKKEIVPNHIDTDRSVSRREYLEALVFQKLERGENPAQAIVFLTYLKSAAYEKEKHKLLLQEVQEKTVFGSLQRIMFTAFAILGMIAFFDRVFNAHELSSSSATPPVAERQH